MKIFLNWNIRIFQISPKSGSLKYITVLIWNVQIIDFTRSFKYYACNIRWLTMRVMLLDDDQISKCWLLTMFDENVAVLFSLCLFQMCITRFKKLLSQNSGFIVFLLVSTGKSWWKKAEWENWAYLRHCVLSHIKFREKVLFVPGIFVFLNDITCFMYIRNEAETWKHCYIYCKHHWSNFDGN